MSHVLIEFAYKYTIWYVFVCMCASASQEHLARSRGSQTYRLQTHGKHMK